VTDAAAVAAERPITHRRVLAIALPIVLSNATVPLLGAVDTGVVGQLGQAAPIGAVGVGAIVLGTVYWIFGFLRMGTTGMVGQAAGAGDRDEVSALLARALLIALGGGLALVALRPAIFAGAFALSPASAEVEALARTYMRIRLWSAPCAIAVYALTGWLVAMERTRGVFLIQVAMNGVNIGLDLLFVLGFGWGVAGVAVATVIAEVAGAGHGLWLCRDAFARPAWRDPRRVFDRARLWRMAAVNGDILVRSLLLMAIFTSFLFLGARFGDVTLAANQVLMQFLNITAYALDGFAFAAESLVARAFGAGDRAQLRRAAGLASLWGGGCVVVLAAGFATAGPWLVDLMTTAGAVRAEARAHLPWMVLAPLTGVAAWMLDGIFIGATRSRDMRDMMAVAAAVYLGAVLVLMPALGNHGLWLALHVSFAARGVTLGLRYPALERAAGGG
jgi:MATE family multidrug resistance protein